MAKLILEFDLANAESKKEAEYALKGVDALIAIYDIHDLLRRYRKYHEFTDDATYTFFDKLAQEIYDITKGLPELY